MSRLAAAIAKGLLSGVPFVSGVLGIPMLLGHRAAQPVVPIINVVQRPGLELLWFINRTFDIGQSGPCVVLSYWWFTPTIFVRTLLSWVAGVSALAFAFQRVHAIQLDV